MLDPYADVEMGDYTDTVKAGARRGIPNYLEKSMWDGVRFWRLQSSRYRTR